MAVCHSGAWVHPVLWAIVLVTSSWGTRLSAALCFLSQPHWACLWCRPLLSSQLSTQACAACILQHSRLTAAIFYSRRRTPHPNCPHWISNFCRADFSASHTTWSSDAPPPVWLFPNNWDDGWLLSCVFLSWPLHGSDPHYSLLVAGSPSPLLAL